MSLLYTHIQAQPVFHLYIISTYPRRKSKWHIVNYLKVAENHLSGLIFNFKFITQLIYHICQCQSCPRSQHFLVSLFSSKYNVYYVHYFEKGTTQSYMIRMWCGSIEQSTSGSLVFHAWDPGVVYSTIAVANLTGVVLVVPVSGFIIVFWFVLHPGP